jgi:hypothetical protein
VVATNVGAMTELLQSGRGFLIGGFEFRDVWGNSRRVWINQVYAATSLKDIEGGSGIQSIIDRAYEYVTKRTWDITAKQLHNKIQEIFG